MKLTKKHLIIGIISMFILWGGSGITLYFIFDSTNRGTFGDMFGAINALFSGFAMVGVVVSIYIQRQELHTQIEELKESKEEYRLNRVTNLLFKQIEYLNFKIDGLKFNTNEASSNHSEKVTMENFNSIVDDSIEKNLPSEIILMHFRHNEESLFILLTVVYASMKSIDKILDKSSIGDEEISYLKEIFKANINPRALKILNM